MYGLRQRQEAWRHWQAAAGPWVGWSICLPLVVPSLEGFARSQQSGSEDDADALASQLAEALPNGGTAIVLDLEPRLGVQVAARLNQQQLSYVVLVLARWPHAEAVLPGEGLLHALVVESRRLDLAGAELKNVVFVLDAERGKRVDRPADDPRIDNRYQVSAADLPKLSELRRANIQRVLKVSHT